MWDVEVEVEVDVEVCVDLYDGSKFYDGKQVMSIVTKDIHTGWRD